MRRRYNPNEGELFASPSEARDILREHASDIDRERDQNLRSIDWCEDLREGIERSNDRK